MAVCGGRVCEQALARRQGLRRVRHVAAACDPASLTRRLQNFAGLGAGKSANRAEHPLQ